jgi:transcription elongation factor Elf1
MPKYSPSSIERVKSADIRLFVPGATPMKANQTVTCPFCGKRKMSVVHMPERGKNFAYCFSCNNSFPDPIKAVMHTHNLDWLKALERVAIESGIILSPDN